MNLWFLLKHKFERHIQTNGDIKLTGRKFQEGNTFNAIRMGQNSSIVLLGSADWYPLKNGSGNCGWVLSGSGSLSIDAYDGVTNKIIATYKFVAGAKPQKVTCPIPLNSGNIVISSNTECGKHIFLSVMENCQHNHIYDLAKGNGVELGPGPKPRIQQTDRTSVIYIEHFNSDNYLSQYPQFKNKISNIEEQWQRYRIGSANHIPQDLGQLDFIFSAHVIEHLPNPIGHFKIWCDRLNKGGKILGIVPNIKGCDDFLRHEPTLLTEWIELSVSGTVDHAEEWQYFKHEKHFGKSAQQLLSEDQRPHFSFFTEKNLNQLLEWCCCNLGYSSYAINSAVNNVSIDFWLER